MTLTKEEKRYGPANTWAVLHLDSAADSRDIISVCGELKRHFSQTGKNQKGLTKEC
ncbi:hypothetical protein J4454_01460 [Candidatus Pacearchaeota archaeon]|nr:hypothetical protein [Candidatus Pacearchaeota archaeon]